MLLWLILIKQRPITCHSCDLVGKQPITCHSNSKHPITQHSGYFDWKQPDHTYPRATFEKVCLLVYKKFNPIDIEDSGTVISASAYASLSLPDFPILPPPLPVPCRALAIHYKAVPVRLQYQVIYLYLLVLFLICIPIKPLSANAPAPSPVFFPTCPPA